ncbi:hypothetical protein J6590_004288 [Homalodisca vitripennis]|nr:hypothetical protein J6590_004288 [Homalodisca vitripennis]
MKTVIPCNGQGRTESQSLVSVTTAVGATTNTEAGRTEPSNRIQYHRGFQCTGVPKCEARDIDLNQAIEYSTAEVFQCTGVPKCEARDIDLNQAIEYSTAEVFQCTGVPKYYEARDTEN